MTAKFESIENYKEYTNISKKISSLFYDALGDRPDAYELSCNMQELVLMTFNEIFKEGVKAGRKEVSQSIDQIVDRIEETSKLAAERLERSRTTYSKY